VNEPSGTRPVRRQHSADPSVRNPHECTPPVDTEENEPPGASARPSALDPQQATTPSTRTAQEWKAPADTTVKEPPGGFALPSSLLPQHTNDPSVSSPHE